MSQDSPNTIVASPTSISPITPQTPKHGLACSKCNLPLGDQLVRALDGAFHPECFTCWVKNTK
jgi:hypothetical protein